MLPFTANLFTIKLIRDYCIELTDSFAIFSSGTL